MGNNFASNPKPVQDEYCLQVNRAWKWGEHLGSLELMVIPVKMTQPRAVHWDGEDRTGLGAICQPENILVNYL